MFSLNAQDWSELYKGSHVHKRGGCIGQSYGALCTSMVAVEMHSKA